MTSACDQATVDIGSEVLRHIPGCVSTEVDIHFTWDRGIYVAKVRELTQLYEENDIGPGRILARPAATWEDIRATEELE